MKTILTKSQTMKTAISALCIFFLINENSYAQPTMKLPTNANNYWYSYPSSDVTVGLNVCSIPAVAGNNLIIASSTIYAASSTYNGDIYVTDVNIPATASISAFTGFSSSFTVTSDLAIGNSTGSNRSICPTCDENTDYILANAFTNSSGYVQIDFYRVHDNGLVISITSLSSSIILTSYAPQHIHIDAIADFHLNSGNCYKFVATWDDYTSSTHPKVWAAYGDFNAGTLGTPVQINPGTNDGYAPDIAGVQTSVSGNIDDVAYITYIDPNNNNLYWREYDFTTSAFVGGQRTLNSGTGVVSQSNPRIDAIDNYNYNTSSANANWEVVDGIYDGTSHKVYNFDNITSSFIPSGVINIPSAGVAPYTSYSGSYNSVEPSVSVADDGTSSNSYNYSILHYFILSGGGFNDILFMEPLNFTATNALANNEYYWVNGNTTGPVPPQYFDAEESWFLNATCSAPSDPLKPTVYAWAETIASSLKDTIYYKLSTAHTASPYYQFRHSPFVNNSVANSQDLVEMYPNPNIGEFTLRGELNTKAKDVSIEVIDMLGQTVFRDVAAVNNGSINKNVTLGHNIANGNYFIRIKNDNINKMIKFSIYH